MNMPDHVAVMIIGAGPAGLAAANRMTAQGLDVVLLDEQDQPGGQIFRAMGRASSDKLARLGSEYQHGKALIERFLASQALYVNNARVWAIEQGKHVYFSRAGRAHRITADKLILTSGAMERPVPFPGWTLPGVMNAGAGQILYKAHDIVPDDSVVLAGCGPLLSLLAWQYLQEGIKVQAILDMAPGANRYRALRHLPKALRAYRYLLKGLKYEWDLRRAKVPIYRRVTELTATGQCQLQGISFRQHGKTYSFTTEHLLVHFGVIPTNQLSHIAGCRHTWHEQQGCWVPQTDVWGQSSHPNVFVAGDGAGIGGAKAAEMCGELAALKVSAELGLIDQARLYEMGTPLFKARNQDVSIRPFLEAYFDVPASLSAQVPDETTVCRCEEVTASEIRQAISAGHADVNQVKFLTRCGMGPCQGRQCGQALTHIVAASTGVTPEAAGAYRARPPANVLTLEELAKLYPQEME